MARCAGILLICIFQTLFDMIITAPSSPGKVSDNDMKAAGTRRATTFAKASAEPVYFLPDHTKARAMKQREKLEKGRRDRFRDM